MARHDVPRPRSDSAEALESLDSPDSVLTATVSEGRLWRKSSSTLRVVDRGLVWGNESGRAIIPWAAINDVSVTGSELEVRYVWPYVNDGDAVMRFQLSPMLGYLFYEEIRRRMELEPMRAGMSG